MYLIDDNQQSITYMHMKQILLFIFQTTVIICDVKHKIVNHDLFMSNTNLIFDFKTILLN